MQLFWHKTQGHVPKDVAVPTEEIWTLQAQAGLAKGTMPAC